MLKHNLFTKNILLVAKVFLFFAIGLSSCISRIEETSSLQQAEFSTVTSSIEDQSIDSTSTRHIPTPVITVTSSLSTKTKSDLEDSTHSSSEGENHSIPTVAVTRGIVTTTATIITELGCSSCDTETASPTHENAKSTIPEMNLELLFINHLGSLYLLEWEGADVKPRLLHELVITYALSPSGYHLGLIYETNEALQFLIWNLQTNEKQFAELPISNTLMSNDSTVALTWINEDTLLLLYGKSFDVWFEAYDTYYMQMNERDFRRLDYPINPNDCLIEGGQSVHNLTVWCQINHQESSAYYIFEAEWVGFVEDMAPTHELHRMFPGYLGAWSKDLSRYIFPNTQPFQETITLVEYAEEKASIVPFANGESSHYYQLKWSYDSSYVSFFGNNCKQPSIIFCNKVIDSLSGELVWDTSMIDTSSHTIVWSPKQSIVAAGANIGQGSEIILYDIASSTELRRVSIDIPISQLIAWK